MKISENWLRRWVPDAPAGAELAERLTMAGLEVDGIEQRAVAFQGVLAGRVLSARPHPEREDASLCEVDAGGAAPRTVVCGAPNARAGLVAAFAPPGAVLPGERRIEAAVIGGSRSEGMLCSELELGIGPEGGGILELPAGIEPGRPLAELLSGADTVLEIGLTPDRGDCLINIILDGENAWEYYHENGYHFLSELYSRLVSHPALELSTISAFLDNHAPEPIREDRLVAGSWVYGTFSTWIGDPDKNRAWELLIEAKRAFDTQVKSGALGAEELAAAEQQLAICEGSDWFWWFGDYNPAATVGQFDYLFRLHLANLYQLLKVAAPGNLSEVISRGGGQPSRGGVMRHHQQDAGGPG